MYIIKNALRCIGRAKGRNILIGVIVLVIAVSSCVGLSIRQAAENAKKETLSRMNVTATISFDRNAAMSQISGRSEGTEESGRPGGSGGSGRFDRNQFAGMMGASSSLSLEEYLVYATAPSVDDFYYTMNVYVNGRDGLEPVSTETEEETSNDNSTHDNSTQSGMPGGFGGMMGGGNRVFGFNSDFTVVGYSSENAMTSFRNGTAVISEGAIFAAGEANNECIITEELAVFNDLSVGDSICITNPNHEDELYTLTVVGIYTDSSANESSFSMFGSTSTDPANAIYMSYATLQQILDESKAAAEAMTDEGSTVPALSGTLSGTYVFADVESYEAFEAEARALGLAETYTITSSDASSYESGLIPLNTLSTMAGYFLIVILAIGAIILVVLNIFNVRERKYEIGVLTAMGMKKGKVALQFLTEIFAVTLIAVVIGVGIGGASSLPVTNALLKNQVASQNEQSEQVEQNFGRGDFGGNYGGNFGGNYADRNMGGGRPTNNSGFFSNMFGTNNEISYVTEVDSAMNLTVVFQMLAICILLTLISGAVSMLFVMRYEPLKILANRD